jgi:alpha-L-rhamnosidase
MLTALLAAIVSAATAQPHWIAPAAPVPVATAPSWIWASAPGVPVPTARNAPAGTVYLARAFDCPPGTTATLSLAADNSATAYLNGEEVLRSTAWSSLSTTDLTLRGGANLLVIEAVNDATPGIPPERTINPGGLIARVAFTLPDGSITNIDSGEGWVGLPERWPGFPAEAPPGQSPAVILGPSSVAPWSLPAAAFTPARPCPVLRRSFILPLAPSAAPVRVIGLGHYELRCNGEVVGDTLINQAWSQYDKSIYWQEFDLAPHLRAGENVLAVTLGNSFWSVGPVNDSGRFAKTDAMPDFSDGWPHLFWLEGTIETQAGPIPIASDGQWVWTESPLTFSHIYAGEDYDARLTQPGWDRPGFDDRAWKPVVIAAPPAGAPAPNPAPGMKAFDVFPPVEIKRPAPGIFTYVFPQNCSALLRFTLAGGQAGSRVRFRPCEYMDDSGRVKFTYTWGTGKDIWHDYIKAGPGEESHQTLFCFVGAQFVQVEGAVPPGEPNPDNLPVLTNLEQVHVRAACPAVGSFSSSSPMHNAAHRLIDWSIRSNMAHVPTDCPHREKNGWIEQDWHMARSLSYSFDIQGWFTKTCRDIRDTQQEDGHIPTNCPNYLVGVPPHGFWNNAPEWGIAGVLVPWHLYEWYGDRQVLEASYESARRYIDYLGTTADRGIITSNLGDWYDFGHGKGNGPSQWTPNEVSATAIWAIGADTLARSAEVLGREKEARHYREFFNQIRRDFLRRFYDPKSKTVKNNGSCQAANSVALCAGLIPDEDREAALQAVIADLEARGWKQTPGEVLQIFLIRALAEAGRSDVLHRIYNRDDIPSYGHMVNSGLTTLPESWDARRGTGDSLNHFMLGQLMEWHYAYVAGIRQRPGTVGWSNILIAPQPPPADDNSLHAITSTEAIFDSPSGRIASRWRIEDGQFALECEVPVGTEAAAVLPDGSRHALKPGSTALRCPYP